MPKPLRFYPPHIAQTLQLTEQLKQWQQASAVDIQQSQHTQLARLFEHAARYSPWWRQQLEQAGWQPGTHANDVLRALPPLTRSTIQQQSQQLQAHWPGLQTERLLQASSSGSTGIPVRVNKDPDTYLPLYSAVSWLETLWHQRDPNLRFAVLGSGAKAADYPAWGQFYQALGYRGASQVRATESATLDGHLDWLAAFQPAYLKCSPPMAAELAERALQRGIQIPLQQVISQWERITPRHRAVCQKAFNAPIVDRYSCEEVGWLALECHTHGKLHVVSPSVLMEIVDDHNQPCPPGQPGRVLVTALQSAVMPMIRYELGDIAQWGQPCECGLHWPVIDALLGRERHMIVRPDGRRIPMPFLGDEIGQLPLITAFRIRQFQQRDLELQVVATKVLTDTDCRQLHQIFVRNGLGGWPLHISQMQEIDWGTGRKRQEFVAVDNAWQPKSPFVTNHQP